MGAETTQSTKAEETLHVPDTPDLLIDDREADRLKIALWLRQNTSPPQLYVTIEDGRFDQHHTLEVPDPTRARHYFEHPMQYVGGAAIEATITGNQAA